MEHRLPACVLLTSPAMFSRYWKNTVWRSEQKHRLEAYAPLASGLSSDHPEPSRELSPCAWSNDATAQSSIGFQPVFRPHR